MNKTLSLLPLQVTVVITKYKTNGTEEIGLTGTVGTYNDILVLRKVINDRFITVGLETLNNDALDIHISIIREIRLLHSVTVDRNVRY